MQKIKEMSLWKKIMSVIVVLFIIGALIPTNAILVLAEDVVEVEYKENLDIDFKQYIDDQESQNINLDRIEVTDEDGQEFKAPYKVGEYNVVISYKGEKEKLKVIIEDTTPPTIELNQDVVAFENEGIDYEDYVTIHDESNYNVSVNDSNVVYNKSGQYIAVMSVEDVYGNKTKYDIPVTINKLQLTIKQKNISLKENSTGKIEIETNSHSKVTYTSSNEDVATVDASGTITAKKPGKATITARVDGKEVTCTVEVKSNQTSNKSTSSSSSNSNSSSKNNSSSSKSNSSSKNNSKSKSTNKDTSYTVYITKTGKKYHRDGCQYLRQSQIAITKSNAISQGYEACSKCHP